MDGLSRNKAAKLFKVSIASAVRWVKHVEITGDISPSALRRRSALRADRSPSRLPQGLIRLHRTLPFSKFRNAKISAFRQGLR